jgi:hypothetical protein
MNTTQKNQKKSNFDRKSKKNANQKVHDNNDSKKKKKKRTAIKATEKQY